MRFMILVPNTEGNEAGQMPTADQLDDMTTYNEQLHKAGVLVSGEGLHPTSQGARMTFHDDGTPDEVVDGPFAEAQELIAGFTIIDVSSREEAIEWLKKWPKSCGFPGQHLELRRVFTDEDFGEEFSDETREREHKMREDLERRGAEG